MSNSNVTILNRAQETEEIVAWIAAHAVSPLTAEDRAWLSSRVPMTAMKVLQFDKEMVLEDKDPCYGWPLEYEIAQRLRRASAKKFPFHLGMDLNFRDFVVDRRKESRSHLLVK